VTLQLLPECPAQIYQLLLLAVMDVLALPWEVTVGLSPSSSPIFMLLGVMGELEAHTALLGPGLHPGCLGLLRW